MFFVVPSIRKVALVLRHRHLGAKSMARIALRMLGGGVFLLLAACATTLSPSTTDGILRLYDGSPLPVTEIAIVKSAPDAMRQDGPAFVTVELMGVDDTRFRQPGGWGNGNFEIHVFPGTYTLHLRYRALRPHAQNAGEFEELVIDEDTAFPLVAQAGHVYWLTGSLIEETASTAQWMPVVFDKARRVAWRRGGDRAPAPGADGSETTSSSIESLADTPSDASQSRESASVVDGHAE